MHEDERAYTGQPPRNHREHARGKNLTEGPVRNQVVLPLFQHFDVRRDLANLFLIPVNLYLLEFDPERE